MATQAPQVPAVPVPPPVPVPAPVVTKLEQILLTLEWIGFSDLGQRTLITDDALGDCVVGCSQRTNVYPEKKIQVQPNG